MSYEMPLADALFHVGRPDLAKTASNRPESYTFESRDATIVSFIQALTKNASAETVFACKQHGQFWGISKQMEEAEIKLAAYQPEDLADRQFALVAEYDGQVIRKYAAHDRDSVFTAAQQFFDDRTCYPLSWRKMAAARLIGRAERFATVLPDYVETYLYKAAGLGYPTTQTLENAYIQREQLLGDEGRDELTKLGQLIEVMGRRQDLRQDEEFVKAAVDVLADIDTHFGLTAHYGQSLDLPEDVLADQLVLPSLQKQASASCRLINGREINVTKLAHDVLQAISPDLTKLSHVELAEVLPTLPKPDADLLVRLAKQGADAEGMNTTVDEPATDTLNDGAGEMAPTDMAAVDPQTSAEVAPSIPAAQDQTAPMDMPGVPSAAAPTTGTPAVESAPTNSFTGPAGLPAMDFSSFGNSAEPQAAAPMDTAPVAPAAPAAPNTFTDETADAMAAAPKADVMTEGEPIAPVARDPRASAAFPAVPGAGAPAVAQFNADRVAGRSSRFGIGQ